MSNSARIAADSTSPAGARITTLCPFFPLHLLVLDAARKRAFREWRQAADDDWRLGTDESAVLVVLATSRWNEAYERRRLALCEWMMQRSKVNRRPSP